MTLLRSALFNLAFYGLCFAALAACRLCGRNLDRMLAIGRWWARSVRACARALVGITWTVTGQENLPAGAAIVAPMHQSAVDIAVWMLLVPRPVFVLKRELARIPLLGPVVRRMDMIVVDRGGGAATLRQVLRQAEAAVAAGRQIVIFPEGTRVAPGRTARLQPGVAAIAVRTGVKLVPAVTDSGRLWGRRAFRKRAGAFQVRVLPPLPPGGGRDTLLAALAGAYAEEAARIGDNSVGGPFPHFRQQGSSAA